jgi:peptidoglycan/xylan/chitin deacetylase (PgdA/CDA1 family)
MYRKIATLSLLAAISLTGCQKIRALIGKKDAATPPVAAATPVATAPSAPAPSSAPPPPPVAAKPAGNLQPPSPPSKPDLNVAKAAPAPPAPARPVIDQSASAMVLCYHNIEDGSKMKALTISVAEFEKEMQEVKQNGFTVIPMQDFIAWRKGEKNIPHKSCVITIDDGWVSAYNNAWPILKKDGYPFTLFIYIEFVGSGGKSMTWDQLAEMRDAGVDIESHTYTHSNLHGKGVKKKIQDEIKAMGYIPWLHKEIIESKQVLETRLGIRCNVFAYPYGVWNKEARAVVKEGGYDAAFTVYGQRLSMHSPPSDLLGRYAVEQGKPKIFQEALAMVGGGVTADEAAAPAMAQLAAASMVTVPMNDETVSSATPVIKANLATMGDIEAGSIELRLSGVGMLPVQFNAETKMLSSQVMQKLKPGGYTVIVSAKVNGQRAETRWSFNVAADAK